MSLKAITEEVPENMTDFYEAREDGKFVLKVEPVDGFGLEDVAGLKRTLEEVKSKATQRKEKLEQFGEITIDQVNEWKSKAETSGKPNEALESLKSEYSGKLTESQQKIEALTNKIKEGNHRNTINSIYANNATDFKEGLGDFAKQVMSKYISTDDNGNPFILNSDGTGARMSNKQGQWENQMTPTEWLEGVKKAVVTQSSFDGIQASDLKAFGSLLASKAGSGSGQGTPNAQGSGMNKEKWDGMNITQKTEWAKNNGNKAFQG